MNAYKVHFPASTSSVIEDLKFLQLLFSSFGSDALQRTNWNAVTFLGVFLFEVLWQRLGHNCLFFQCVFFRLPDIEKTVSENSLYSKVHSTLNNNFAGIGEKKV